jgi:microcystin-dependent protein
MVINGAGNVSVVGRTNLNGPVCINKNFTDIASHNSITPQVDISGTINIIYGSTDFTIDKPRIKLISNSVSNNLSIPTNTGTQSTNEIIGIGQSTGGFLRLSAENSSKSSIDLIGTNSTVGSVYNNTIRFSTAGTERLLINGSGDIVANSSYTPSNTQSLTTKSYVDNAIPLGGIIMWSGSFSTIPTNYRMCDGRSWNGRTTPDLRGKFILSGNVNDQWNSTGGLSFWCSPPGVGYTSSGGEENVTLSEYSMPQHRHYVDWGNWTGAAGAHSHHMGGGISSDMPGNGYSEMVKRNRSGMYTDGVGDHQHYVSGASWTQYTGSGGAHNNMPPYIVLYYIMRCY